MSAKTDNSFIAGQTRQLFFLWILPFILNISLFVLLLNAREGIASLPESGPGSLGNIFLQMVKGYLPYITSIITAFLVLGKKEGNSKQKTWNFFHITYILPIAAYHIVILVNSLLFIYVWRVDAVVYISKLESIIEYGGFFITPIFTFYYLRLSMEKFLK